MFSQFEGKTVSKILHPDKINRNVVASEYAVRGEVVQRAETYNKTLLKQKQTQEKLLPFDELLFCNIGNPQSLGQKPISFFRQAVALIEYPELMKNVTNLPTDVIQTVEKYQSALSSTGAYSHSQGHSLIREFVAKFIQERDGYPCNPDNIFLSDGASQSIQSIIRALLRNEKDGIMIPIPQYPLYSASITLYGGSQIGYFLDEDNNWSLSIEELERSWKEAKDKGIVPRALVIINPGNPTGQVWKNQT